MADRNSENHAGSDVARNKARAAVLDTRDCSDKCATECQNGRLRTTSKNSFSVGTWNVRTLWHAGKYEILQREMDKFQYDILGLCEVRRTGSGKHQDGRMIWSGGNVHQHGVGMLMSNKAKKALMEYNPVNERLLYARFHGYPRDITVIVAYAPTSEHSDEKVEEFYERLEEVLDNTPRKDMKFIVGDWNAKVGSETNGWEDVMGKYGFGERNQRGDRLLLFARQNGLYVANTKFQGRKNTKWTWKSANGISHNMIDFILIEQKWKNFVTQCRAYPSADIGSDHQLVLCNVSIKIKRHRQKCRLTTKYDVESIKKADGKLEKGFQQRLSSQDDADMNTMVKNLEKSMKEAAEKFVMKITPRKHWISQETLTLVGERGERQKRNPTKNTSDQNRAEYKDLCKRIKKSAREDKRKWINEKCTLIESHVGETQSRIAYKTIKQLKGDFKAKTRIIYGKDKKPIIDKEKIRERWTEYARELFTDTNKYDSSVLESLQNRTASLETEEERRDDGILLDEVKKAIKKLKNDTSTGIDNIPAEIIKAGGNTIAKGIHKICNNIWTTGQWPKSWCKSVLVMLPKTGNRKDCTNYRSIALVPHMCKVMLNIIQGRLEGALEEHMSEEQGGFRKDRSAIQQILTLRLIAEQTLETGQKLYNCFIDYKKAFDSVWHEGLWAVLRSMGVCPKLVTVLKNLYEQSEVAVRVDNIIGQWFTATIGSRQGDPTSARLFITKLEKIMETMECTEEGGIKIHGKRIKDIRFAENVDLLAKTQDDLQKQLTELYESSERFGLHINIMKTKVMLIARRQSPTKISVGGKEIECIRQFVYLGSLITSDNNCSEEIKRRIGIATGIFKNLKEIWKSGNLSLNTKLQILSTCVFSSLLYACETWTPKTADLNKVDAFEMKCYRRIMKIKYQDKVKNEKIRNNFGRKKMREIIRERKLQLFGHISRMKDDRLVKLVMTGSIEGKKSGRPARKWMVDIREWCRVKTDQDAVHMAQQRRGVFSK